MTKLTRLIRIRGIRGIRNYKKPKRMIKTKKIKKTAANLQALRINQSRKKVTPNKSQNIWKAMVRFDTVSSFRATSLRAELITTYVFIFLF